MFSQYLIVGPMGAVVVALFLVMWRERESPSEAEVAVIAGTVVLVWAILTAVLAARSFYLLNNLSAFV